MDSKDLIQKRGNLKGRVTKFAEFVKSFKDKPTSITELSMRLSKIESLFERYETIQDELEALDTKELVYRDEFENLFYHTVACAKDLIKAAGDKSVPMRNLQINPIQLPTYDGAFDMWMTFRETFSSLIHSNENIDAITKFHYLLSSLKGEALRLVSSLEVTSQNYQVAWDVLKKRYENKRILIERHIKAIFGLPTIKSENATAIRRMLDELQLHNRALTSLGQQVQHWDMVLIYVISGKLDINTRNVWENHHILKEIPTLEEMIECLNERARVLDSMSKTHPRTDNQRVCHIGTENHNIQCPFCSDNHFLYMCKKFRELPLERRINWVQQNRVCFNCLRVGHSANKCRSRNTCSTCKKRHHTLLHRVHQLQNGEETSLTQRDPTPTAGVSVHSSITKCQVLLPTAIIGLQSQDGSIHRVRALLDSGSQSHFVSEALCKRLNLHTYNVNVSVTGIQNNNMSLRRATNINILSLKSKFNANIECLVLERITTNLPQMDVDASVLRQLKLDELADPFFHKSAPIDVLIGASIFWKIVHPSNESSHPLLHKTSLGWIVSGQVSGYPGQPSRRQVACNVSMSKLNANIEKFWKIEEKTTSSYNLPEYEVCEKHFIDTCTRMSDGRFSVSLPFKVSQPSLGNSFESAKSRLLQIERKFKRQSNLKTEYTAFMREYETLGHMSLATNPPTDAVYIPHHPVFKNGKIRVVFDASSKTSNQISLNDILHKGPVIQSSLFSLLLRFRLYPYVLTADIQKMYRQIWINDEHKKYQFILWRDNEDEEIKHFQLQTVTYGMTPSSFLATRCLKQLSEIYKHQYPLASDRILCDFYMDDLLTGNVNLNTSLQLKEQLIYILGSAGMKLTKWRSNILSACDEDISNEILLTSNDEEYQSKILGLYWNNIKDVFYYRVGSLCKQEIYTKRTLLSEISQFFDPLGLISPVLLPCKLIMQNLWKLQASWDEHLPSEIIAEWMSYREDLENINDISIPRCVTVKELQGACLVGFCDASEKAYGCCIYLRCEDNSGKVTTSLLSSRTRVAPLKSISLPRLELCAAVILCQHMKLVQSSLKLENCEIHLWSDSMVALHWIMGDASRWDVFVANRVSIIQRELTNVTWRHVKSKENPADVTSRGCTAKHLQSSSLWWNGPSWLCESKGSWPLFQSTGSESYESKAVLVAQQPCDFDLLSKYSSFSKLQRVAAYILRFINNAQRKNTKHTGALSVSELAAAHEKIIRLVQESCYYQEIHDLKQNKTVSHKSDIRSLNPFLFNDILRVGGRITNSQADYDQKHQIILPKNHHVTKLIIRECHYSNLHLGVQGIMCLLRLRYWIIQCKNIVKQIIRSCILCSRYRGETGNQIMSDLPRDRVTQFRPFYVCGVDYLGPISVKSGFHRNSKYIKTYVCVFVCFASKAIHIDYTVSLDTNSFLNVLKRFIARRGRPLRIYSDNAGNFKGAAEEIRKFYNMVDSSKARICEFLSQYSIDWKFIPARSPHHGGLWEAAVKLVKRHLRLVLKSACLSHDHLYTFLCQIESIVNSRPITPLSNDSSDLFPLTPGHFLVGGSLSENPADEFFNLPTNTLSSYKLLYNMLQTFWRRWSTEYLQNLQQRSKWMWDTKQQLCIGQMVIIKETNTPPMFWRMGRVIELFPGRDEKIRVAKIKTSNGDLVRNVTSIILLPIEKL